MRAQHTQFLMMGAAAQLTSDRHVQSVKTEHLETVAKAEAAANGREHPIDRLVLASLRACVELMRLRELDKERFRVIEAAIRMRTHFVKLGLAC